MSGSPADYDTAFNRPRDPKSLTLSTTMQSYEAKQEILKWVRGEGIAVGEQKVQDKANDLHKAWTKAAKESKYKNITFYADGSHSCHD